MPSAPRVAMIQSSYVPWKGYFDQIEMADVFVFYDDVQYTKEDWRNRNRIKTPQGAQWLTIPCGEHHLDRRICDVRVDGNPWQEKHWKTLQQNYVKARYFERYRPFLEELYLDRVWTHLSDLNQTFTRRIAREILGSTTEFRDSREFDLSPDKRREARWLDILVELGASELIAGPSARDYLHGRALERVNRRGVEVLWMDYTGYPEYRQLYPPFDHHVSILDLLLNEGPRATAHMLAFGGAGSESRRRVAGDAGQARLRAR